MQMFLTGRCYCDLRAPYLSCGTVYANEDIWQSTADGAQGFQAKHVTPEFCVKYFSKKYVLVSNNDANRICTVNVE